MAPIGRVAEVDGTRRLMLSDCPACHRPHDTVLHVAETKFHAQGFLYPYWSPCPNSDSVRLIMRFDDAGISLVLLERDAIHSMEPAKEPTKGPGLK